MEKQAVHNWFGNITSFPQVVVEPRNVQDLIMIMKDTAAYPSPVRAVGSNHSTTACGVADDGTLVVMRQMNRILSIGPDTVTAQDRLVNPVALLQCLLVQACGIDFRAVLDCLYGSSWVCSWA